MTYAEKEQEVKAAVTELFEEFGGLASNGYDDPDPDAYAETVGKLYEEFHNWRLQHSGRDW